MNHSYFGSRSLVASTSSLAPRTVQPAKPVAVVDIDALQAASRVLSDKFTRDSQTVPDLGELLAGQQSSASYSVFSNDFRVPFQKRRLVTVPESLFQYFGNTGSNSSMGIMPEIERVWITIDHKLFLWDYVEGQEISSFVEQPDVITHVALVKPKAGVFIDEITFLLVICTPVSVLLIGLSASTVPGPNGQPHKDIKLYATDMAIATNIQMASVVGTREGRIFMSGSEDGHLYELHYQEKEGWFGKRVHLINHSVGGIQSILPLFNGPASHERITSLVSDPARNCFYTLTNANTISVYRTLGEKAVQHVQTINNIYKSAQDKAPGSPALTPQSFDIIALHVVQPSESRSGVQLLALTGNGVRLYFAPMVTYTYSYGPSTTSSEPRQLQLVHVRLPPVNLLHPDEQEGQSRRVPTSAYGTPAHATQPARSFVVSSLLASCYVDGQLVSTQSGDTDSRDFMFCTSPDLAQIIPNPNGELAPPPVTQYGNNGSIAGPTKPPLIEHAAMLAIPGQAWAIAAVPRAPVAESGSPAPGTTNELATQFGESPRQFMVLTNNGLTFLVKRRVLDHLKAVMEEYQIEQNNQPIVQFRNDFGRDQTCAMLLGLACGNTFLDLGEGGGTISGLSLELASIAKAAFYDFGEQPMWRITYGTTDGSGTALFSGRREGFAMYFARLVRPIWKARLTSTSPMGLQQSNIQDDALSTTQKNLHALKEFLDKNPQLFHSSTGDPAASRGGNAGTDQEAWRAEQSSVARLIALLARSIEAISFVLLLNDYRLGELIAQCDPEIQTIVGSLTFESLITTQDGMTASRALVNVVIDQQIGQQISVDTISEVLQQRCGSFCSTDDVMLYKAKENIRKAVETRNPMERQNLLAESLRLYAKGARILEFDKLRETCGDYQQLSYAKGAVELPLTCAQILDTDNIGLEYWYAGKPANDPRMEAYERRLRCYDLVLDSLSVFEERSNKTQGTADPSADDAELIRSHAYELAFSNGDEMFQSTLYDWLIERDLADELLEMRPTFLEAHLQREPITLQKYQLLWQFYVKDGQPLRAAEVLGALAETTQIELSLQSRLEYLTLAVGNAKAHPLSVGGRHETAITFLTDLEEKLDVAQVQLELHQHILPYWNDGPHYQEKINGLSKRLLTMSELYQEYAAPLDLVNMKLLILHVSEHRDETLVRPIWNQIFEEALSEEPTEPKVVADRIVSKVVPLGQRFYPSDSAFPLRHVATLLVRFGLANKGELPHGWAPRILIQCRVPYAEIWDVLHGMYESQVPPFNEQANVQAISSDIAVLLSDWINEAARPQSAVARGEFPVARIDAALDQYIAELDSSRADTKSTYENLKRQLRRNW